MSWKTVKDNGITIQFPAGGTHSLRVVFDPSGHDIAYVVPDRRDNGNSNAALIAAAPDLFTACRRLWDAVIDAKHGMPDEVLLAAFECRQAVRKAVIGVEQTPFASDEWLTQRRREQNRAAQQRCRARKKNSQEATNG